MPRSPTGRERSWPARRRGGVLAGAVAALMLASGMAVLVTGADTEGRFEAAQHAYTTLR